MYVVSENQIYNMISGKKNISIRRVIYYATLVFYGNGDERICGHQYVPLESVYTRLR